MASSNTGHINKENFHIPDKILSDFNKKFSKAENIQWKNEDSKFGAVFRSEGVLHMIRYASNGTLLQYSHSLELSDIPKNLLEVLMKGRSGFHLVHLMFDIIGNTYSILWLKNQKFINVTFDDQGKIVHEEKLS